MFLIIGTRQWHIDKRIINPRGEEETHLLLYSQRNSASSPEVWSWTSEGLPERSQHYYKPIVWNLAGNEGKKPQRYLISVFPKMHIHFINVLQKKADNLIHPSSLNTQILKEKESQCPKLTGSQWQLILFLTN